MLLFILIPMMFFFSCKKGNQKEQNVMEKNKSSTQNEDITIGPQFWKYDVSEYEQEQQNVENGMGGRWISVRYKKKAVSDVSTSDMKKRIETALLEDGWESKSLSSYHPVMSKTWETAPEDLYFERNARNDEPSHWFFSQRIHVGEDASVLCVYCEVGW